MRRACLILGLLTLTLIWAGPLLSAWHDSFAAHMLAHMGVVAIASPLLAIGLSPFVRGRWQAAFPSGSPPLLSLALIASLVELVVVWGWHAPAARLWAESSISATILEQSSFLLSGLFLWLTTIGQKETPANDAAGAFALLLTSVHMTLLGALLSLAPRPLYGLEDVSCFGVVLRAGQDQALGGVIMLLIGAAVYLTGGVFLLARLLAGRTGEPAA